MKAVLLSTLLAEKFWAGFHMILCCEGCAIQDALEMEGLKYYHDVVVISCLAALQVL